MTAIGVSPIQTGLSVPTHISATMVVTDSGEPDYDLDEFDDGTVRASGVLPANVRDALLLTHDEGARDPEGRVIWYPKGAGDAA